MLRYFLQPSSTRRGQFLTRYLALDGKSGRKRYNSPMLALIVGLLIPLLVAFSIYRGIAYHGHGRTISPQQAQRSTQFSVFTWNILQGFRFGDGSINLLGVEELIRQQNPDTIGLQESDSLHIWADNRGQ